MVHFFYRRAKSNRETSIRRSVFLALLVIVLIAIPFVDFVIWILFKVVGFGVDDRSIFLFVGPIATIVTVVAIITPMTLIWARLFREIDKERERASKAQMEAERLLAQRSEFVAYVSHEIRNPLNGIIGIADTIVLENLDNEVSQSIDIIKKSSHDLMYILNDVLDLSKIDEGKVQLNETEISLRKTITQLYEFWKARANEKGLKFSLTVCDTFPDFVRIDVNRFRQILNNLISNAIKYSDQGSVLISADCDYQNELALISVSDTGAGIPPSMQDGIFEPYEQVASKNSSAPSKIGTGLGLPIARRLARMMGGDIVLKNSSNAGSNFQFSFKAMLVETPDDVKITDQNLYENLKGKAALVVDDSIANAIVAREHLNRLGLRADIANSGKKALEKLEETVFDFVFLDDNLGDLRGYDVLDAHRGKTNSRFIAYTGRASPEDQKEFQEFGYDGFVAKPALFEDIKTEIARVLLHRED